MPPISEEDSHMSIQNKRDAGLEFTDKELLRPPVYNPEDYAASLKKWAKKGSTGGQLPLYMSQSTGSIERLSLELCLQNKRQSSPSTKSSSSIKSGDEKPSKKESTLKMEKKDLKNKENLSRGMKSDLAKDFLNPILALSMQEEEMSLRQFSSVAELLGKLKVDLKSAFPSFVQEFVGDPIDGVTLLLELLRVVQLTQTSQQHRCPPQILRRALLDEHFCLICLKHCLRCSDAPRRLASSPAGLFTLAVCIMSNVTQSRIIALELLIKACEPSAGGHKAVSEALSTLRLRFGEPVRFRFLVGMLSSAGAIELLAAAMKFINVFVETAPSLQQKVYIQAELEHAGFDSKTLRRTLPSNSESVKAELNKWEKNYFDVEALQEKVSEVNMLHEKIQLLEKRVGILQEEKEILQSLERCLKERCSELEEEVSVKSIPQVKNPSAKPYRDYNVQIVKKNTKGESTPAEDEGISSSEQELSQDEDYVKKVICYSNEPIPIMKNTNLKNIKNKTMKETNVDDGREIIPTNEEDEETTIDKVIEELENIVNDAETEVYAAEEKIEFVNPSQEKFRTYTMRTLMQDNSFEESEIVPAILHPQPPKKAKSLVHIYFPEREFDSSDRNKSEFFDSDSESSDSLLTATRDKIPIRKTHRSVSGSFNSFSSTNTRTLFIKQEMYEERNIDEEEMKRKEIKTKESQQRFKGVTDKILKESPFPRSERTNPTPVKRSQTFHIVSTLEEKLQKRTDMKPKPKMGVSGLDYRNAEQKTKWQSDVDRYVKKPPNADVQFSPNIDRLKQIKVAKDLRSKSLEKMDEGLDSLVDIVIATDETKKPKKTEPEVTKNIGPRTRRSLAESSLFSPQYAKNLKPEEAPKPPKPAERTSLTRNNSSSTPMHLPMEIKLTHVQPKQQSQFIYNFGLKPAKSEGSLLATRSPPDGASGEKSTKTTKTQRFFNQDEITPSPRNVQNKMAALKRTENDKQPSFLIGTYQSQTTLHSINAFANNAFLKSNNQLSQKTGFNENIKKNRTCDSNRQFSTEKVTDSPSGLY